MPQTVRSPCEDVSPVSNRLGRPPARILRLLTRGTASGRRSGSVLPRSGAPLIWSYLPAKLANATSRPVLSCASVPRRLLILTPVT